jgi:8-oxo-dGTP pyrophosphatase MutT (NUDIX family)
MGHIHHRFDYAITVLIVHDTKVLFVNHPRYNRWVPIGGHIELDENPKQALHREISEETGLTVRILADEPQAGNDAVSKSLPTPNYLCAYDANPPHKHVGLVYFAHSTTATAVMSNEHTSMKWFTLQQLRDPAYGITPSLQFYAAEALRAARTH